ncbi:hypothetical protein K439DRAFT_412856 [Ramaria rubella]|nr:hypothetical protein K439DRAFT_412856 [Ramaria rubella]
MAIDDTITSTLQYFAPPKDGSAPWLDATATDPEKTSNFGIMAKEVQIENIRGKEAAYSLDTAGFQYIAHAPSHMKFDNEEAIKREYYPESVQLLKKLTGANRVIIFDHTIRKHRPGEPEADVTGRRQPATRVHVDQTPGAAERRVHMHAPPELAPELLKHRYQIINLWRPISHAALDFPLALCDYRTVNWNKDLIPAVLKYADRNGEVFGVQYNPEHRWKYVRGMRPEEGVLIKCFDSKMDGSVAVLTPHTAFSDPSTPQDAPRRQSIEIRALVFYDNLPNGA